MDTREITDVIVNSVSCLDAGHALGLKTDYKGRCKCPFHGGTHNNLKLYEQNRGFYCFVCHEHGTVIGFVMKFLNIDYMGAVRWINDTFGLNLRLTAGTVWEREKRARRFAEKTLGKSGTELGKRSPQA